MAINSGYTLTAYFNTGFNGVDIPADASVLETAQKTVYSDNYFLREDVDKPTISVNDTYANLRDCDYVKLTPKTGNSGGVTCYYFCVPSAAAHGTTILALELDALLTMGGAKNLNYISGWQERGHVTTADDGLFENTAPEDFAPRKPLITRGKDFDLTPTSHASADAKLIVSTVDLTDVADTDMKVDVITGVDSLDDEKMYFPQIKVNDDSYITEFRTLTAWPDGGSAVNSLYKLPSTTAFLYTAADVKRGLKALYSAGQLSLMASYVIPKEYIDSAGIVVFSGKQSAVNYIYHVNEKINMHADSAFDFAFDVQGYTIKNKKVYSMFNDYQILNIASGAASIKAASELYKTGENAPAVIVWSDTSPNGKPAARFGFIKDVANLFSDVVYGSPWYQQQLVFEGASGSLWNSINAAFANATLNRNAQENRLLQQYTAAQFGRDTARLNYNARYAAESIAIDAGFNVAKGAIGAIGNGMGGDISGAVSGAVDVAQSAINSARAFGNNVSQWAMNNADMQAKYNLEKANQAIAAQNIAQQINENSIGLLKNNQIVSPTILFTPSDTLALYGQNKFVGYHVTMDDDDIKELDKYFQRYGYNGLHRQLTASCFNARQYYSYVQAFDVNIKSPFGMRIRQKAISQLNKGVRVWKVLPDAQYYETN